MSSIDHETPSGGLTRKFSKDRWAFSERVTSGLIMLMVAVVAVFLWTRQEHIAPPAANPAAEISTTAP